jgi:hypothetical protein
MHVHEATTSLGNCSLTFRGNRVVSSLKIKILFLDISTLEGEATYCLETSGTDCPVEWHHIPEEWKRQLHFCENLKTLSIYSDIHI